ncbi:MAG TPA: secretin N-terminal domain-containing protein [Steroidobacteraceae bacterium]|nr:secretin N-terminal domain-containing protein [Steroidobacteraceae bacterium]
MKLRSFFCCSVLLLITSFAYAADLAVIDLHNRTAEELLPILKPMAGDASLSGLNYKLFVRGSAADVARIREMLNVLDRAQQQLLISVRYSSNPVSNEVEARAGGTIAKRGVEVSIGGSSTRSTASDSSTSSVRVLEGNGAHISNGQSMPIVSAMLLKPATQDHGPSVGIATDYRELTSGFDVLPRINGDRVVLDISSQQQRAGNLGAGSATTQRTTTTVSGKLGEWIELGGVSESSSQQNNGIGVFSGSRRIATQSDQRTIFVKVEKVQ